MSVCKCVCVCVYVYMNVRVFERAYECVRVCKDYGSKTPKAEMQHLKES